jgi:hypothetical protein
VSSSPASPPPASPPPPASSSRLGLFIEKYSSFLSSFVIGMAGLIATSIWQYRQSVNAAVEARTQSELAQTKAKNDWRIARAEILAKNLDVLAIQGPGSADRKFGVLLSLTRGNILDPELAVSYALELGKENSYYMRSVLGSTTSKNYAQLAQAFIPTCIQRFGVERDVELCKDDKLSDRSLAIAALLQDDLEAASVVQPLPKSSDRDEIDGVLDGAVNKGPLSLVEREEDVQAMPVKLAWLFEPYLQDLYEHKRWTEIDKFEKFSAGARLVSALVLATSRTGELLSEEEGKQLAEFHSTRRRWLASYLLGRNCDPDCRARLVEFMLSTVQESDGDYDDVLTQVLLRPRAEVGGAINHIHTRILWCQIDPDDLALLRDRVIVPAAVRALVPSASAVPAQDRVMRSDLVGLMALLAAPTDGKAKAEFDKVLAAIRTDNDLQKLLTTRMATAQRQRANPPPMVKKVNFCGAASNGERTTGGY